MNTSLTAYVGAAIKAASNSLKPEWLRVPDAVRLFGISRSSLYELITSGEIKSTALRKRGAVRGIRIINFDSLAAFCERAASGGSDIEAMTPPAELARLGDAGSVQQITEAGK